MEQRGDDHLFVGPVALGALSLIHIYIFDIEIAHGIEGAGGTLLLAVDARQAASFSDALRTKGYQVGQE